MKIEMRPISEIKLYENNPRHNDQAVEAVADSIRQFGFRQPLVLDEGDTIIVGSTRYKAARLLGLKTVPVHVAVGLSPAQIKAYRLADNKTAELADWNYDLLIKELADLRTLDFDAQGLGFTGEELQDLLDRETSPLQVDPDAIPDPPDAPITQRGDLWILGKHRLMCGDAGSIQDVDALLAGSPVHLVNCDPPYNVRVEPRSHNAIAAGNSSFPGAAKARLHHQAFDVSRQGSKKATTPKLRAKDRPLANDFLTDEAFTKLLGDWFGNLSRVLLPGRSFYFWGGYANIANYPPALKAAGLYFSQTIIWHKQHAVLTRKDYMGDHEWAFYGWKEGKAHSFFGPANATDVWSVKKINPQNMVHLTEKPVELATRALTNSSKRRENVLDLFGGSGSTLVAAEQLGRKAYLMEIDGLYCDVIVQRWENFTGKKAKRESCRGT